MPFLSPPAYDACLLSSETIRFDDERVDWAPAVGGNLHPALCPSCTAKTSTVGELFLKSSVASDITQSLDGFYIVSPSAQVELMSIGVSTFHTIRGSKYCALMLEDLPTIQVDGEASGLRNSEICGSCGEIRETLLGIDTSVRPPRAMEIVVPNSPFAFARTDLRFGAGFHRVEKLFISNDALAQFHANSLSGVDLTKWG